ncbi:trace amine-associated receptor 13c-like [Archocentrus centrarchus]|uniref:trace amine-associated receptor 13c-like n=1 Tax=Archocentrus centrarchus TaxID=63155 RepID=UPI0011EA12BE|nr:trace amine-associated receptor 13c-like [Archocentrus centrarchus]
MKIFEEVELCFPQILNSSCRKTIRPRCLSVLIYITLSSIALLTVILNLLLIISISHFKKLHTPTNLLLLSLAVSDCFVGLLMFFQIMIIDGCWFLGDLMCSLYFLLDYIITSASVGTMVLISIDRYVAICYPLHYSTKVTPKRAKACVYLCWICSSLFQCLVLKDNLVQPGRYNSCYGECVVVVGHAFGVADLLLSFVGPVIVIVVLYLRVFVVAVSQARALRSHIAAVTHEGSVSTNVKKSEMKALRTISVVIIVFLICLCPYYCVTVSDQDAMLSASSATFVVCLFYLNSCINPLIYALFYPWFRKSVKQIVTLEILKSGSCEANIM